MNFLRRLHKFWPFKKKIASSTLLKRGKARKLQLVSIESFAAYQKYFKLQKDVNVERAAIESQCIGSGKEFSTSAYCYTCAVKRPLLTSYAYAPEPINGVQLPNWREHLRCEFCGLNNRMRAAVQIFEMLSAGDRSPSIYITEQTTPLYRWLKEQYSDIAGSEYLGDAVPYGVDDGRGIRNESLTKLTWDSQQFDYILSFDVFEHVPDYLSTFSECARVLRPGGKLLFTVPFLVHSESNLMRSRITDDGSVEHLLTPEYHGDPLSNAGCLAFYHFGWKMFEEICHRGFSNVEALFYWSRELGYLGLDQVIFVAKVADRR